MNSRLANIAAALIAAAALAGCAPTTVADDVGRGAARGADDVPVSPGSGVDDVPVSPGSGVDDGAGIGGSTIDDAARAEESAQARGTLETMAAGDARTWVCLGLDVVEASSDGDLTFEEYGSVLVEHGFSQIPRYRAEQAYYASVQLLEGDLTALKDLACV